MKKRLQNLCILTFSGLIAVTSGVFVGCKRATFTEPPAPPQRYPQFSVLPDKEEIFTPTPPKNSEKRIPAPTKSDFWDVENVDVSRIDYGRKHIAFTFDDSPNRTLEQIVGVFTEYNQANPDCVACATVFYNGVGFNEYTLPAAQAAYAVGFEAGNHTFSHSNLCELDLETLQKEIDGVDELLKKIDGKERHLLRAPYGKINQVVRDAAKTPIIDWSVDTLDWTGLTSEEICERVYAGLEDGGIVLMHDGPKNTVEALKILLPELKARGYQITSVSQLSKINACALKTSGAYTRARKR